MHLIKNSVILFYVLLRFPTSATSKKRTVLFVFFSDIIKQIAIGPSDTTATVKGLLTYFSSCLEVFPPWDIIIKIFHSDEFFLLMLL